MPNSFPSRLHNVQSDLQSPNKTNAVLVGIIAVGLMIAAGLGWFRPAQAQPVETPDPDFIFRWGNVPYEFNQPGVGRLLHIKTGSCWVMVQHHGPAMVPARPEVCK